MANRKCISLRCESTGAAVLLVDPSSPAWTARLRLRVTAEAAVAA
jgi:hypothetical protein